VCSSGGHLRPASRLHVDSSPFALLDLPCPAMSAQITPFSACQLPPLRANRSRVFGGPAFGPSQTFPRSRRGGLGFIYTFPLRKKVSGKSALLEEVPASGPLGGLTRL
jgi:hypothetical protein